MIGMRIPTSQDTSPDSPLSTRDNKIESYCDIYGCENETVMRTKNIGTGRELDLCKFHGSHYLRFPMERCIEPRLRHYAPDCENRNVWSVPLVEV